MQTIRQKFTTRTIRLLGPQQVNLAIAAIEHAPIDVERPLEFVLREERKVRRQDQNQAMWAGTLRDIEEQAIIIKTNEAGQVFAVDNTGRPFDIFKHVGETFYATPPSLQAAVQAAIERASKLVRAAADMDRARTFEASPSPDLDALEDAIRAISQKGVTYPKPEITFAEPGKYTVTASNALPPHDNPVFEWVQLDGISYATPQSIAWEVKRLKARVKELEVEPCCQEWNTCAKRCVPLAENWRMAAGIAEQRVKELDAEAEAFCTRERKWFADLRAAENRVRELSEECAAAVTLRRDLRIANERVKELEAELARDEALFIFNREEAERAKKNVKELDAEVEVLREQNAAMNKRIVDRGGL